ncbi:MAG: hypothetical protein H0W72_05625 [Planctomycetes bacterium]|nr:hypothetical protein [Planctomycetota bacterium]
MVTIANRVGHPLQRLALDALKHLAEPQRNEWIARCVAEPARFPYRFWMIDALLRDHDHARLVDALEIYLDSGPIAWDMLPLLDRLADAHVPGSELGKRLQMVIERHAGTATTVAELGGLQGPCLRGYQLPPTVWPRVQARLQHPDGVAENGGFWPLDLLLAISSVDARSALRTMVGHAKHGQEACDLLARMERGSGSPESLAALLRAASSGERRYLIDTMLVIGGEAALPHVRALVNEQDLLDPDFQWLVLGLRAEDVVERFRAVGICLPRVEPDADADHARPRWTVIKALERAGVAQHCVRDRGLDPQNLEEFLQRLGRGNPWLGIEQVIIWPKMSDVDLGPRVGGAVVGGSLFTTMLDRDLGWLEPGANKRVVDRMLVARGRPERLHRVSIDDGDANLVIIAEEQALRNVCAPIGWRVHPDEQDPAFAARVAERLTPPAP